LREAPLDVSTEASSPNFAHAQRTLAFNATSAPPPAPIKSPKQQNLYVYAFPFTYTEPPHEVRQIEIMIRICYNPNIRNSIRHTEQNQIQSNNIDRMQHVF